MPNTPAHELAIARSPADGAQNPHRRHLLELALTGGAMAALGPMAWAQTGAPKRGGTLTIGADADPIGTSKSKSDSFSWLSHIDHVVIILNYF